MNKDAFYLFTFFSIDEERKEKQELDARLKMQDFSVKKIDFSIPFHCTRNDKPNVIAFANERQSFEVNVKRKAV